MYENNIVLIWQPLVCMYVLKEYMLSEVEQLEKIIYPLLQPLRWRCGDYVIHHERDVREE